MPDAAEEGEEVEEDEVEVEVVYKSSKELGSSSRTGVYEIKKRNKEIKKEDSLS